MESSSHGRTRRSTSSRTACTTARASSRECAATTRSSGRRGSATPGRGVRAKAPSWRRIGPDSLIPHAKASGQYLNSVLAKVESVKSGYDEAILLDDHGHVCEGTGENVCIVRDGEIAARGQHNSILDGIPRRSLIQIAQDLGYTVVE